MRNRRIGKETGRQQNSKTDICLVGITDIRLTCEQNDTKPQIDCCGFVLPERV